MESGGDLAGRGGTLAADEPGSHAGAVLVGPRRGPRPAPLMAVAALPGVVPRTSGTLTGAGPLLTK